jgi:small subunit ribosomal protein S21
MENSFGKPVEVEVRDSLEKAMKILKQKMSKEGILQELKRRRFYEKPSVKKKRKTREARKRLRREMKRRVTPAPARCAPWPTSRTAPPCSARWRQR